MNGEEKHFYQFKSFRLDVGEHQLLNNNSPVPLTPKAFDVLALLVERGGHLIERDELMKLVWADSFVEEQNITRIIHLLRKTLGEDENGNKFIETVAKKGYRFVAKVSEVCETPEPETANGKQDFLRSVPEPPAVAGGFSAAIDPPATAGGSDIPQIVTPPVVKPKQKTRLVLFAVGFLSAVFLLLLLSFNFQSESSSNPNEVKSIAVLPVQPLTAENREPIYEFGIADSLINKLSSAKGLIVRPLSATRRYADIEQDAIAAGREQKTDYVLASNYQIADGEIRVTAQLFNVATGQTEETYKSEKETGNIFATQDAIAGEVGNIILARFSANESSPAAKRGTTNEEAYRLYLQGNNLTARRSPADARKAIEYFEQAIRLDTNYARAYTGLARSYIAVSNLGSGLPHEENKKAKEMVKKALELDNNLSEAHQVLGSIKFGYEWDFAGAEKDLLRAIELEPNSDSAHNTFANYLSAVGRFDEAITEIKIALDIDPNSLSIQRNYGRFLYSARRYDEAIVQLKRVIELDAGFLTTYAWLWQAYHLKGDHAEAYKWFLKFHQQRKVSPERIELYQNAYETSGWRGVLQKQVEIHKSDKKGEGDHPPNFRIGLLSALLGDKDQAFEYLNKSFEQRYGQMAVLKVEPCFDSLRDDPRFEELVRRVGLK